MGTCCSAHLATKIRDYAKNAQNGAVTVTVIENPKVVNNPDGSYKGGACDFCKAPAEFTCTYYSR